ncbi:unnamed protein product, partial [Rotaria sp. Silwood2]
MPHLRIFDIKNDGCVSKSTSTYHELINQFSLLYCGTFYSTEPFRRNYYKFYWSLNKQICSYIETKHFNSVKYIYIYGINDNNNTNNNNNNNNIYFSNVIELKLEQCMEHLDYSLSEILNNILPLHKIRTVIIKKFYLHLKQLIEILYYRYSSNTIEIDYLFYDDSEQFLFKRNNDVEHISKINNVKTFNLLYNCNVEKIQLIFNLFSQLEYLKIGIKNKEIKPTMEYILLNNFNNMLNLCFLCITDINMIYLKQVTKLIDNKKLLSAPE